MSDLNKTFILSTYGYDYEQNYYFLGSSDISQEEFKQYCDSLLPEAANRAIKYKNKYQIRWSEIFNQLIVLLKENGYVEVEFKKCMYSEIIRLENAEFEELVGKDAFNKIKEINTKIEAKSNEDFKKEVEQERNVPVEVKVLDATCVNCGLQITKPVSENQYLLYPKRWSHVRDGYATFNCSEKEAVPNEHTVVKRNVKYVKLDVVNCHRL